MLPSFVELKMSENVECQSYNLRRARLALSVTTMAHAFLRCPSGRKARCGMLVALVR